MLVQLLDCGLSSYNPLFQPHTAAAGLRETWRTFELASMVHQTPADSVTKVIREPSN